MDDCKVPSLDFIVLFPFLYLTIKASSESSSICSFLHVRFVGACRKVSCNHGAQAQKAFSRVFTL